MPANPGADSGENRCEDEEQQEQEPFENAGDEPGRALDGRLDLPVVLLERDDSRLRAESERVIRAEHAPLPAPLADLRDGHALEDVLKV